MSCEEAQARFLKMTSLIFSCLTDKAIYDPLTFSGKRGCTCFSVFFVVVPKVTIL